MRIVLPTNRQKAISSLVLRNQVLAEVGCDHALLGVYLLQNNIVPKVIASDISPHSIKKAQAIAQECCVADRLETRLGDGLTVLEKGEAAQVVIAGMGGEKMVEILNSDISNELHLILQPMSGSPVLRKWLFEHNFKITTELTARVNHRFYEIIQAEKGVMPQPFDFDFPYMPALIAKETFLAFLQKNLHTIDNALSRHAHVQEEKSKHQIELLKDKRKRILEVQKCLL